jgi:hypothetical protein
MHIPIFHGWLTRRWERWTEGGSSDAPIVDGTIEPKLRYNARYRWSMVAGFLLVAWLCWYGWAHPEAFADDPAWVLWFVRVGLSVTVLIGIGELVQAFRWSVVVGDSELVITRTTGKRERLAFSEIEAVVEDAKKRELVLIGPHGRESRISYQAHGLAYLRRRLQSVTSQTFIA